jgi:hypothetical protein
MATTTIDLRDDDPTIPAVGFRFEGALGAPIVVIPGAVLSPADAVAYAQRIFACAASACAQSRLDVAGHG